VTTPADRTEALIAQAESWRLTGSGAAYTFDLVTNLAAALAAEKERAHAETVAAMEMATELAGAEALVVELREALAPLLALVVDELALPVEPGENEWPQVVAAREALARAAGETAP